MQDDTLELVETLLHSLKARGIKKTSDILKVVASESLFETDDYTIFVVNNVCRLTGVDINEILHGRYFRGDNKFAVGLCVQYLYQKYSIGDIQKKVFYTKSCSLLAKYRYLVLNLNPKYKADQKNIIIKKEMDELVSKYNNK